MSRRTRIMLVACAVLAVVLFIAPWVSGPDADSKEREEGWQGRIEGLSSPVDPQTLGFSGDCAYNLKAARLAVRGVCEVIVPAVTGIPLVGAARKLSFDIRSGSVMVTATVRGDTHSEKLDAGESGSFGFDAEQQTFEFANADPLGDPAEVIFKED